MALVLFVLLGLNLARQFLPWTARWPVSAIFVVVLAWLLCLLEFVSLSGWIRWRIHGFILPVSGAGLALAAMALRDPTVFMWIIPMLFIAFMRMPLRWALGWGVAIMLLAQGVALFIWHVERELLVRISVSGYFSLVLFALFFNASETTLRQLGRTSEVLDASLQSMGQGFLLVKPDGRVVMFNDQVLSMLDLPATLLETKPRLMDLVRFQQARGDYGVDYATLEPDARNYLKSLAEGSPAPEPVRYTLSTPAGRHLDIQSHALPSGDIVKTLTDITEYAAAKAQAEAASQAKSQFLASMSHEIRSPLNAILGLAYLLEQANLDADAIQMVSKIRASGSMLLGLISDILDVSKIEAGQMMIEQAPFRLTHVIDNLANVLSVAVGAKEIKLIIEPAPAGVGSLIGDALRLEQVLLNLSINAIKFTSVGQVALRTELLSDTFEAVTLKFSVHDTGIGIAPALQGSVFAAFTQADSSTTRRFGGTGLGLTICRQLVHLMGGEIGVNSVLGQGSEFWFTVTLQKAADADVADVPDPVGTPLALAPPNGQSLLGLRVLVTDDSEINCEVARRILQGQGAIVSLASNGQEALDWLLAHPTEVDLVLMDVQMPVLDGLEATRQLRRMPEFAELPIVALTAGAFKSQQDEARAVGMTHFISKPFDVPSTLALIQRLCRRPAPSPQPQAPAAPTPAPSELVMDVAQGLEIWMDMPSYLDCLPRFVKSYHDAVAVMQARLAQGDRAGAIALAHKLAGDAANMALPDTRRLAAQAERVLRSELDPAPALADLALALARALAEIESLCTPAEVVYKANQAVAPVDTA
jgi:signal transduction histidine kinase/DNA-binding NarL/FixJ family response regulator